MIREDGSSTVDALGSDTMLSTLAEATNEMLWVCTADWETFVFMNDSYEDIWGRSLGELRDDPDEFLRGVHSEDRDDVQEMIQRTSEGETVEREIRVSDDEGDRWVEIEAHPVQRDGDVTHIAGTARDVTERRAREVELDERRRELEDSKEELQQFAYIASHDLQEPLRMVRSYMNILESEYKDKLDEEAEEYIGFAVDGAARMKALIEGLLEYSRIETRGGEFESVEAAATVDAAKKALGLTIENSGASIDTAELPTVTADRNQLSRVFQNLISNAIEATDEGAPAIDIRSEERPDAYVFTVEDDGAGFPENETEMFDIFQQGPDADEGTGVGLAITKRIVERHGGELWVESTPDAGSTVYFSLAKSPSNGD